MPQKILWISKLLSASLLVCSCASWTTPPKKDFSAPPLEKVFNESFDTVWRATQFAASKYAMKISDIDSGVYETQPIRSDKAWVSPNAGADEHPSAGQRYKISIKILKGKDANNEPATRVTILKRAEVQRDFFSDFEKLPSDGLEEKSLMYRIEREIQIEKSLKKVKKESSAS